MSKICANSSVLGVLDIVHLSSSIQGKRGIHSVTGDVIVPSQVLGIDHLRDPRLNKVSQPSKYVFSESNVCSIKNCSLLRLLKLLETFLLCSKQSSLVDFPQGLAFTLEERQALGIHGLQPARFKTQEEQLELCRISVSRYQEDLNKYLYLTELHERNEKLFFRLLSENVEQLMPIVYTPTVGLACQKFGLIYRRPRGIFITVNDRGHCYDVIKNWCLN